MTPIKKTDEKIFEIKKMISLVTKEIRDLDDMYMRAKKMLHELQEILFNLEECNYEI